MSIYDLLTHLGSCVMLVHRVSLSLSLFFEPKSRFRIQLEAFDFTDRGLRKERIRAEPMETINFPSACKVYLKPVSDSRQNLREVLSSSFARLFKEHLRSFLAWEHFVALSLDEVYRL